MDSKTLEQLLEKYWNCETSLEEERVLKDYFRDQSIPESLKDTATLFRYFDQQAKVTLKDVAFEGSIRHQMNVSPKEQKQGKPVSIFFNFARIAAGLVVVVAAGYFIRTELRKAYPPETADTYNDPKLAFEETKKALLMISRTFGKAKKETEKINLFNEAEQKIQRKPLKSEELKKTAI